MKNMFSPPTCIYSIELSQIASMPAFRPPAPDYLAPLSMPYGENWGAAVNQQSEEPAIPGLDLIYQQDVPMDIEEDETPLQEDNIDMPDNQHINDATQEYTEVNTSGKQPPAEEVIEEKEPEEDEEAKLRAKLLQSLMRRRKEKADSEVQ